MAQKYQVGDAAYIVESNRFIREVKITKHIAGLYIIKFVDSGCDRIKNVNAKIKTQCALQNVLEPVGSPAVSLF